MIGGGGYRTGVVVAGAAAAAAAAGGGVTAVDVAVGISLAVLVGDEAVEDDGGTADMVEEGD